jgi:alkylation response protein AidB-like acyl-CoA dehydrogenase
MEKSSPGHSFNRPEGKMGLRSTSSKEMTFSDCGVSVKNLIGEGDGLQVIGKSLVGWGFYRTASETAQAGYR